MTEGQWQGQVKMLSTKITGEIDEQATVLIGGQHKIWTEDSYKGMK